MNGRKICVDKNCKDTFKVGHQSITIQQLQEKLILWLKQKNINGTEVCKDFLRAYIRQSMDELKRNLDQLEDQLMSSYYNQVDMNNYLIVVDQLRLINMAKLDLVDDNKLNELAKFQLKEHYIESLIKIKNNIQCQCYNMASQVKKVVFTYLNNSDDLVEKIQQPIQQIIWSREMKSSHVELISDTLASHSSLKNDCLVLTSNQLKENDLTSVQFKIVNSGNLVALGMANYQIQKQKGFLFDSSNLKGTGLFLIINNGQPFVDTQHLLKMDTEAFNFSNDDIIEIDYNPFQGTIKFSNKNKSFLLRVNQKPADLRFCAYLYGAQVEILKN